MKTIVEYDVKGDTSGMIRCYPKNNKLVKFKDIVLDNLESYSDYHKSSYGLWEKYDEFIDKVLENYSLDIDLEKLNDNKLEYIKMKSNSSFYTEDDFNTLINNINDEYKTIIEIIENKTDKKFGKDYILL